MSDIVLPADIVLAPRFEVDLLGGVTVLSGTALRRMASRGEGLYRLFCPGFVEQDITLVPCYAWANRGQHAMTVWLPWY